MSDQKMTTGKARLSYPNLFKPRDAEKPGAKPKFGCSLIIPKAAEKTLELIERCTQAAIAKGLETWGNLSAKQIQKLKLPLRDGDEDRDTQPEYADAFFINCTTATKPGIFDRDNQPIIDETEVYAGCFVRASLNFYPYDFEGTKGVAVGLNLIQKLGDGEPLSGAHADPEEDFKDDVLDEEAFDFMF